MASSNSNVEQQQDEVVALQSIYGNEVLQVSQNEKGFWNGRISVAVEIPANQSVSVVYSGKITALHYLPPVSLVFEFPPNYPSTEPPSFLLFCCWLSQSAVDKLRSSLHDQWLNFGYGSSILFSWIQEIADSAFSFAQLPLNVHHLSKSYRNKTVTAVAGGTPKGSESPSPQTTTPIAALSNDNTEVDKAIACSSSAAAKPVRKARSHSHSFSYDRSSLVPQYTPLQLLNILLDYNAMKRQEQFEQSTFCCEICYSDQSGANCVQFQPCAHIFCNDCAKSYFEVLLKDGNVHGLRCMASACEGELSQCQIRRLLGEELFERFDQLLLQRTLETMSDIVQCPRMLCQATVVCDSALEKMATCGSCGFTFCTLCKRAYHGIAPCAFNKASKRKLLKDYMAGDGQAKSLLDKKFGALKMKQLMEELFAERWIEKHSKHCPTCHAPFEKLDGCNKMVCVRCRTKFCWLCMSAIYDANPYDHFNRVNSPCYNQLWDDVPESDEEELQGDAGEPQEEEKFENWWDFSDESSGDEEYER